MPSILPADGIPVILATDVSAVNAYIPPETFTMSCTYEVLPNTCEARILPSQINAIVSEMIALMACFAPDGNFDCTQVNNLCANFTIYNDVLQTTLTNIDARLTALDGGGVQTNRYSYAPGVAGVQNIAQDSNARITDWTGVATTAAGVTYAAGVWTITEAGFWSVSAMVNVGQQSISESTGIYVNGVMVAHNGSVSNTNNQRAGSVAAVIPLVETDTVEVRFNVSAEAGGAFNLSSGRFCMLKVGDL